MVGVDLASGAIERARQLAADRGVGNVRFEDDSVYALPFPAASFDVVFSLLTLLLVAHLLVRLGQFIGGLGSPLAMTR